MAKRTHKYGIMPLRKETDLSISRQRRSRLDFKVEQVPELALRRAAGAAGLDRVQLD